MYIEVGEIIKQTREEKRLTREELCENITDIETLRAIEANNCDESYWLIRVLLGRLHVHNSGIIYYLDSDENYLLNLENEIMRDLLLWRYEEAEKKLKDFYQICEKNQPLQMLIYYRLLMMSKRSHSTITKQEIETIYNFLQETIPEYERQILLKKPLSPDELALIIEYYETMEAEIEVRKNNFYSVLFYMESEYATEATMYPIYAILKFYYAKCLYQSAEYEECVKQCKDGLQVSTFFRTCYMNAELYELMADANGKLQEGSARTEESAIREILKEYSIAESIYDIFYCGYNNGHSEKIKEKIEVWKTMISL